MSPIAVPTQQFCTFEVDGLLFGVEVLRVQEVLKARVLEPVPLAHEAVKGLLNLRGEIVTAIDLRPRLGRPPRPLGAAPMFVVTPTEDGVVALLADAVGDVIDVEESTFEAPPKSLSPEACALVPGVFKLSGRLLHLLDVERAADLST